MQPTLQSSMTSHPHSIRLDENVHTARRRMAEWGVRHLPVLAGGELRGVISDRDLKIVVGDPTRVAIEDVCVDEPITFDVDTSLSVVAALMAERRVGSVLVTERGKVVGIFTTTDACRVLATLLQPQR